MESITPISTRHWCVSEDLGAGVVPHRAKDDGEEKENGDASLPCSCAELTQLDHICSLRSFRTLDNFEFNRVAFVQALVSLDYNCRVVDKYIWTVVARDEAVALRIVEPFDSALHLASSLDRPGSLYFPSF